MQGAQERLHAARRNLEEDLPFAAVGLAYYAMLYAARAVLSEEDLYAKTHSGSWTLFNDAFVRTSRFPADAVSPVQGSARAARAPTTRPRTRATSRPRATCATPSASWPP